MYSFYKFKIKKDYNLYKFFRYFKYYSNFIQIHNSKLICPKSPLSLLLLLSDPIFSGRL